MNEPTPWHALDIDRLLTELKSSRDGLSQEEADARLRQYGPNAIPELPPKKLLVVYLDQFKNAFIYLLLIAAGISIFLGEYSDAIFIVVALQINAVIGTIQEWQAQEKALSLRSLVASTVTVFRGGAHRDIDGRELVPGDIVELEMGTRIPAAMRLLQDEGLEVDESLLTGESMPVSKKTVQGLEEQTPLADRSNMLHAGTTIMHGRATAVVTATGLRTEVGQVADSLKYIDEVTPPLIGRMKTFTHVVATLMVAVIGLIAFAEFMRDTDPTVILLTSVALAVAAIPEGLPVALTVALAISVSRMAKRDVVVRKMAAVEGLGACTLIAADKTGTLTINELSVQRAYLPGIGEVAITDVIGQSDPDSGSSAGESVETSDIDHGESGHNETVEVQKTANRMAMRDESTNAFLRLVRAGLLCNEARLEEQKDGSVKIFGDTVDGALLKLGRKATIEKAQLEKEFPQQDRIPYEPALAFAASFHQVDDKLYSFVKGAAEVILSYCQDESAAEIHKQVDSLAAQGYRVIAMAEGPVNGTSKNDLTGLEFLGLVALIDPLRPSAKSTVQRCRDAGVAVRMITGDHPKTALEIGRQLEIADDSDDVVTGSQLASLESDQTAFDALVARTRIFARTAPLQKLSIVQSMQRAGNTVAVTGDGVNDASALAAADIGAAMGKSGTDIARSASDLILVNDELSSLVDGIEEGRIAYDNIRKVIYLLIATGAAELVLFLASIAAGLPMPLTAVQLIWLNLVTQGIQDVALAFEKGEPEVLKRRPRPPKEGIFNRQMIEQTLLSGLVMGGTAFVIYQLMINAQMEPLVASNLLLLILTLFVNAHVFNCRSESRSAFAVPLRNNPFLVIGVISVQLIHLLAMNLPGLSVVLDIQPVSPGVWFRSAMLAVAIIVVMEIYKVFKRSAHPSEPDRGRNY